MDKIEDVPEELLFKLLSFLDKASLARMRELNHFWKRLASDELLWKYLCTEQAERHQKLFSFSLDQARLSHGSWMTLFARRECFANRARCTQCFVYVIDRSVMKLVSPLELFCCNSCNFAATTSAATAQRNFLLTYSEVSALPHAKTYMQEYLMRDVKRLALQKWGSKERLDALITSKREQQKERKEERKADGESRKRKVDQLLEDEKLVSMKLPRAVQEMVKKYVRFGEEGRWAQYTFDEVSTRLHRVRLVTSLCELFSKELQNPVLRGLFWRQVDVLDTKQPLEELQRQFTLLFLARVKVREARVALLQHRCLNELNLKLEFDGDQHLINAASLPYSARAAIEGFISAEEVADIRVALTDINDALALAHRLSAEKKAFHDQLAAAGLSLNDEDVPAVLSRVANCQLGSLNPDRYHLDPAHMPRVLEALAAVRERRAHLLKSAAEAGVPYDFVIGTWAGHEYVHYGRGYLAELVADAAGLFRRNEWMAQFRSHLTRDCFARDAPELWLRLCDTDELENEAILEPAEAARITKHLMEISAFKPPAGLLTRAIEVVLAVSTLYTGDGAMSAADVYVKMHKVFGNSLPVSLLPNVRTVASAMAAARGYDAATRRINIGLLHPKEQMELALQPIMLPTVHKEVAHKVSLAMEE